MDLADKDQVVALLQWVEDTEGSVTASECKKIVAEWLAENRRVIQSRLALVDLARSRAHALEVKKANELAKAKLDSHFRYDN